VAQAGASMPTARMATICAARRGIWKWAGIGRRDYWLRDFPGARPARR
jgi:hypothetical protein